MPQFGLSSTNSHWGYGAAGAYSPYFTPSTLGSCTAPTASQFNTPALGFSGSTPDQSSTQDAFGSTSNVSSCEYVDERIGEKCAKNFFVCKHRPVHKTGDYNVIKTSARLYSFVESMPKTILIEWNMTFITSRIFFWKKSKLMKSFARLRSWNITGGRTIDRSS